MYRLISEWCIISEKDFKEIQNYGSRDVLFVYFFVFYFWWTNIEDFFVIVVDDEKNNSTEYMHTLWMRSN